MSLPDSDAPVVYVIDDDDAMRRSVVFLCESVGWHAVAYTGPAALLAAAGTLAPCGCLVLDVRMPGMSGLELLRTLRGRGIRLPALFITGHGDVPLAVQAMKEGATDFLEKPFRDQALLDAIERSVRASRQDLGATRRRGEVEALLARLTPREREVAVRVARGQPNKVIARALDISEKTVHVHRAHVLEKMQARGATELAHLMMLADPAFVHDAGAGAGPGAGPSPGPGGR